MASALAWENPVAHLPTKLLLMFFGTVSATLPYVGIILLAVIAAWMVAVYYLGKQFQSLVAHHETISIKETATGTAEESREIAT